MCVGASLTRCQRVANTDSASGSEKEASERGGSRHNNENRPSRADSQTRPFNPNYTDTTSESEDDEDDQAEVSIILASFDTESGAYHAMVLDRLNTDIKSSTCSPFRHQQPWRKGFTRTLAQLDACNVSKFESHLSHLNDVLGMEAMALLMDSDDAAAWAEQCYPPKTWRGLDGLKIPLRYTTKGATLLRNYYIALVNDIPKAMKKMRTLSCILSSLAPRVHDCLVIDLKQDIPDDMGLAPWDPQDKHILASLHKKLATRHGAGFASSECCATPGCQFPPNPVAGGWNGGGCYCCNACMTQGATSHGDRCLGKQESKAPTEEASAQGMNGMQEMLRQIQSELETLRALQTQKNETQGDANTTTPSSEGRNAATEDTLAVTPYGTPGSTALSGLSHLSEYTDVYPEPTEKQMASYRASAHWVDIQMILKRSYSPVVTDEVAQHRLFLPRVARYEYTGSAMEKALSAFMRDETLHPSRKLGNGADANHVSIEDRALIFRNYVQLLVPVLKEALEAGLPITSWLIRLRSSILSQLAKRGEDTLATNHNFVQTISSLEQCRCLWTSMKATAGGAVEGDTSVLCDLFVELLSRNYVNASTSFEGQSKKRFENFKRSNGSLHECMRGLSQQYLNMKNQSNPDNLSRPVMFATREHIIALLDKLLEVVAVDPNRPWARELRNHMRKDIDDVIGLLQVDKATLDDLAPWPNSTLMKKWANQEIFLSAEAERVGNMLRPNQNQNGRRRGGDAPYRPDSDQASRSQQPQQAQREDHEARQRVLEESRNRPRDRPQKDDYTNRTREPFSFRPSPRENDGNSGGRHRVAAAVSNNRPWEDYEYGEVSESHQGSTTSTVAHVGAPMNQRKPESETSRNSGDGERRPWSSGRDRSPSSEGFTRSRFNGGNPPPSGDGGRPRFNGGSPASSAQNNSTNTQNRQGSNAPPWQSKSNDQPNASRGGEIDVVWGGQRNSLIPKSWTLDEIKAFKRNYIHLNILDNLLGSPSAGEAARIRPLKPYDRNNPPLQQTGEQNPPPTMDAAAGKRIWLPGSCAYCVNTPAPPADCKLPIHHQYCFGHHQSNHSSCRCYAAKLAILYSKDNRIREAFCPIELRKYQDPPPQ